MSIKIDYDEIKENVQGLTDAAEACVAEERIRKIQRQPLRQIVHAEFLLINLRI